MVAGDAQVEDGALPDGPAEELAARRTGAASPTGGAGRGDGEGGAGLGRGLTWLLAVACGVAVADIYFPQAVSPLIARDFGVSGNSAALVSTAAQLGYAAGIFLLVPLGDRFVHRRLLGTLSLLTGLGLVLAGVAPNLPTLVVASGVSGATTVVPQIILPMAASLVPAGRRAATGGRLLSGLIAGILLARTFSGTVGDWLGWRAPYLIAAGLMVLFAVLLARLLPPTTPTSAHRYPALLAESVRLLRAEPGLRRSGLCQALLFGGFSAAWTSVALLFDGPKYGLGPTAVGILALVGAASVFGTPVAGRWIDRTGPDPVNLACVLGAAAAAVLLAGGAFGHVAGFAALVPGFILLDLAIQCSQVANQARIFALRPDARSRLNTAYMTCSFLGGSAGSWLGVRAYAAFGWLGVCGLIAAGALLALLHVALRHPRHDPR